jgi:hypothetical protein
MDSLAIPASENLHRAGLLRRKNKSSRDIGLTPGRARQEIAAIIGGEKNGCASALGSVRPQAQRSLAKNGLHARGVKT